MRPRTCGGARPAEASGLSGCYRKQQAGPCWMVRAGPGGHLLSLLCSRDSPRHGARARRTAPQGFCGPWAPGVPQRCPAHCHLPCPGTLTGPPGSFSQTPVSPELQHLSLYPRHPRGLGGSCPPCLYLAALPAALHSDSLWTTVPGPSLPPARWGLEGALKPARLRACSLIWVITQWAERRMPRSPVRWWWTREEGKGECRCGHLL